MGQEFGHGVTGLAFFHIVLMVISRWYSASGYVGLEGDSFSHMSGAFAWMAGKLGSVGPLIGAPTCSPSVMVG